MNRSFLLGLWLRALLRGENLRAVYGSLRRRLRKQPFLTMRLDLVGALPESPVPIRPFRAGDERELLRFLNGIGSFGYWTSVRLQREILLDVRDRSEIFLVFEEDRLAAMTVLHTNLHARRPVPEIGFVAVAPDRRGRGLSQALLRRALNTARSAGHRTLMLKTDSFREPAIRSYLRIGFRPESLTEAEDKRWAPLIAGLGGGESSPDFPT